MNLSGWRHGLGIMTGKALRILVAILLLGGGVGLAFWSGLERRCPLRLPESQRELGPLHEMTLRDVSVDLTNAGAEPLKITGFRNDCNCVEFTPETFTLPAGATQKVTLTIRPSFLPKYQQADGTAKWDMILEPRVEGWPQRQLARWRLKGHVVRLFQDWPHQIALAGPALTGKPATVTVPYTLTQPIKDLAVENPNPWIVATLEPKDELSGLLRLAFHEYAMGYQEQVIRLKGKLENGVAVNSPSLQVMGSADHLVQLEPTQVMLGVIRPGTKFQAVILIRAAGKIPPKLLECLPPKGLNVEATPDANAIRLRLFSDSMPSGVLPEPLRLTLRVDERATKEFVIPLIAYGTDQ